MIERGKGSEDIVDTGTSTVIVIPAGIGQGLGQVLETGAIGEEDLILGQEAEMIGEGTTGQMGVRNGALDDSYIGEAEREIWTIDVGVVELLLPIARFGWRGKKVLIIYTRCNNSSQLIMALYV